MSQLHKKNIAPFFKVALHQKSFYKKKINHFYHARKMMIDAFMREPVYYLAAPYTHSDESIKMDRLKIVLKAAFDLIQKGYLIYSPLTHNTPIDALGIFGDFETWSRSDHNMLYRCDGLFVLKLKGWEESKGVAAEMTMAKHFGLSIQYVEWNDELNTTSMPPLSKET